MGGLEGSQRPPPSSSGPEQGWELRGAGLRLESQDSWEGSGELFSPPGFGVGERGLHPLLLGPCLTPRAHATHREQADDTSARQCPGQTGAQGPSKGAAKPNLTFKDTVCMCGSDSWVRPQIPGVLGPVCSGLHRQVGEDAQPRGQGLGLPFLFLRDAAHAVGRGDAPLHPLQWLGPCRPL